MGASRKLQGEIDRVLKKVHEGVEVYDGIWKKFYDTDNVNLKEKFEADLKKEIKKLQRHRDQIKTWIQSSEIKDKKVSASYEQALIDARKLIEREMERFKICEKEMKTKAFSKEGLGLQPKTDPKEKAKSETRDWINNVVSELENEIDSFEAEMEGISVRKGKTRPPRLMLLETSIARHKAHVMKLESILRLLDNEELSPEQVNDVKDLLDDYVERNQDDFDEFSDVDELYSSLPLDKVESLEDLVPVGPPSNLKGISSSSAAVKPPSSTAPTQHAQANATCNHGDDTASHDDTAPITPPPKSAALGLSAIQTPAAGQVTPVAVNASSSITRSSVTKDDGTAKYSIRKPPPDDIAETGLPAVGKGGVPGQSISNIIPSSGISISSCGTLGAIPLVSETSRRNISGSDDRVGSPGIALSPLSNRALLPQAKTSDVLGSAEIGTANDAAGMVSGMQWRPGTSFQDQNEAGQVHAGASIYPDQREKFLQRFHQVQQGQSSILSMPLLAGGNQFFPQQQGLLLQQFNGQGPAVPLPPQLGSSGIDLAETGLIKIEEWQQQQSLLEDSSADSRSNSELAKNLPEEIDMKSSYPIYAAAALSLSELSEATSEMDLSPVQPLQAVSSSGNLGLIGRTSVSDLDTIMDSISPSSTADSGGMRGQLYNLRMLEAAFRRLPQPKDSERTKSYTPRHPAVTPLSYPQVPAPLVSDLAFWERLGSDTNRTDSCFFSFYYQQNTYQQYLAAKSLKKQAWGYHTKYNTWFRRHPEPKVATDDFERGTYAYFDFNVASDEPTGWCQRIKKDFAFEYSFLEDELRVN